jgi:hypothetical protein
MQTSLSFVQRFIDTALAEEPLTSEDKALIVNYYKCVCFGLTIDWLEGGMKEESVQAFRKVFALETAHASALHRTESAPSPR